MLERKTAETKLVKEKEIVKVEKVSRKFYGETALHDITFHVSEGEKVILFGHNGSGKTTLIRCLMGFESFEGEISIFGYDVKKLPPEIKKSIGYVPQVHPIIPYTVKDLVDFAVLSKGSKEHMEEIADELEFDIKSVYRKKVNELSGGMRQKLFLTLALMGSPKILILDEPFSNLDVKSQTKLSEILSSSNTTQIISTHRIEDVLFAQRVIYLQSGKIQTDLPKEKFLEAFRFILKGDGKVE